jgi:hypothetical protein
VDGRSAIIKIQFGFNRARASCAASRARGSRTIPGCPTSGTVEIAPRRTTPGSARDVKLAEPIERFVRR